MVWLESAGQECLKPIGGTGVYTDRFIITIGGVFQPIIAELLF